MEYGLFSCPVGTTFDASKLIPTGVSDPKTILLLLCTAMSNNSLNSLCSPLNAPVLVFWSFTTVAEYSPYHPKASCPLMFQYAIRYSPRIEYGRFSKEVGTIDDASNTSCP